MFMKNIRKQFLCSCTICVVAIGTVAIFGGGGGGLYSAELGQESVEYIVSARLGQGKQLAV